MKIGDKNIIKTYLGSNLIQKAYLGTKLIQLSSTGVIPEFAATNEFTVVEGLVDLTIGTVVATDPNSEAIAYSITGGFDQDSIIVIDEETGVLSFTETSSYDIPMDTFYDGYNTYYLLIRATNESEYYAEKNIKVKVEKDNSISNGIVLSASDIDENSALNAEIGTFSMVDESSGWTFAFTSGTGSTDNGRFVISVGGDLLVNSVLNYESVKRCMIRVIATKDGEESITDNFVITINNVVEAPIDITLSQNFIISENNAIGSLICTLNTVNAEALAGTSTYTIDESGDYAHFNIPEDTNELRAAIEFNYETQVFHTISIVATNDTGSITKSFTLTVTNVNEAPVFVGNQTNFNINEGSTNVGTITFIDPESQTITYSMDASGVDSSKFNISSGGLITFKPEWIPNYSFPADVGGNNTYDIIVRGTDPNLLYTTKALTVKVFPSSSKIWYVAPTDHATTPGVDTGNILGDLTHPFATLNKAWSVVSAGDTIYMKGGTYAFTTQQNLTGKNGVPGNLIKIWAVNDEVPILSKDASYTANYGINFRANYVHIRGVDITGYVQKTVANGGGNVSAGLYCWGGDGNKFESIRSYGNGLGILLRGDQGTFTGTNEFINCDCFENYDPNSSTAYGNSDGLQVAFNPNTSAITYITNCRSWYNGDDGFDNYSNDGMVVYNNCWSYANGFRENHITVGGNGDGFKLGPVRTDVSGMLKRQFINCVAAYNNNHGFDFNYSVDLVNPQYAFKCELYNCSAYHNGGPTTFGNGYNFNDTTAEHLFVNCVAVKNRNGSLTQTGQAAIKDNIGTIVTTSTFLKGIFQGNALYPADDTDFIDVDATELYSSRVAGVLPEISFLHLTLASELVDSGTTLLVNNLYNVGPDLGAFPYIYSDTNYAPVITEGDTVAFDVAEGSTLVGRIHATDANLDTITFMKMPGLDENLFSVNSSNGEILFLTPQSYIIDGDNSKSLVISVSDGLLSDSITVTVNTISLATLPNGIVSAWELDETSGSTCVDSASGGNDLTVSGATLNQEGIILSDPCILFNGTTDYVRCADNANLSFINSFSMSFWIKPTTLSGYRVLAHKGDITTGRNGYAIYTTSGVLSFDIYTNVGYRTVSLVGIVPNNTVSNIVVTYGNDVAIGYINGISVGTSGIIANRPTDGTGTLTIGADSNGETNYAGYMSKVYVWDRVLNSIEVSRLWYDGAGNNYPFV